MALSDLSCKNAKPKDRLYRLFDGGGLYLEVTPKGQRYWRMKYRIFDKEKRLSFGAYPLVSLNDARTKHEAAKRSLLEGVDPAEIKREEKRLAKFNAEQTFQVVAEEWYTNYQTRWSTSHAENIIYRLKKDFFPVIGHIKISGITPPIAYDCVRRIDNRGKHEMARRALQMIGQVMRYAVITGRAERDPTPELKGSMLRYNKGHFASI